MFLKYYPGQMTCAQFEQFVLDYTEDELPTSQRSRFEYHMRICPMCNSAFATYLRTIEITGQVLKDQSPTAMVEAPQDLVNAMLSARRG